MSTDTSIQLPVGSNHCRLKRSKGAVIHREYDYTFKSLPKTTRISEFRSAYKNQLHFDLWAMDNWEMKFQNLVSFMVTSKVMKNISMNLTLHWKL